VADRGADFDELRGIKFQKRKKRKQNKTKSTNLLAQHPYLYLT
jgi:hypothetical protein